MSVLNKTMFWGLFFGSMASALGGIGFTVTRLALPETDPFTLSFLRWFIMLLGLSLFSIKLLKKVRFAQKDLLKVCILGIAYFSGFPICLTFGLEFTTSGRAGILFASMPIWTIIIATSFKIENFSITKFIAIFLAFSGVVLSLSSNLADNTTQKLLGDMIITIGVISASVFTVFAKGLIKNYGNQPIMIYSLIWCFIYVCYCYSIWHSLFGFNKFQPIRMVLCIYSGDSLRGINDLFMGVSSQNDISNTSRCLQWI